MKIAAQIIACLLLLAQAPPLTAQQPVEEAFQTPPLTAQQPVEGMFQAPDARQADTNEVRQTIRQALRDLRSENEDVRIAAAQLLGKYDHPRARRGLIFALNDDSAKVRRSAVISLTERNVLNDTAECEAVLAKLADADVEVRRAVSNALPFLTQRLAFSRIVAIQPDGQFPQPYTLPAPQREALIAALDDPDDVVRLNALKYCRLFSVRPDARQLARRLRDANREIVLLALQGCVSVAWTVEIQQAMIELMRNADAAIRQEVALTLLYRTEQGLLQPLEALTSDPNPITRIAAKLVLAGEKRLPVREWRQSLIDDFNALRSESQQALNLLYQLYRLGDAATPVYLALTEHGVPRLRAIAWKQFLGQAESPNVDRRWLRAMDDASELVRQQAQSAVLIRKCPLAEDTMRRLIENPREDVRAFAVQQLEFLTPEQGRGLILALLIDQESEVRLRALRMLHRKRYAGWERLLQRSLLDSSFDIQREAVRLLAGSGAEGQEYLEQFARENPQAPITEYIQLRLNRGQTLQNVN